MARQVEAMLELKAGGSVVFEEGNNLRVQAKGAGVQGGLRDRRVRGEVPEAPVLPGNRAVPLGGPQR